MNYKLFKLEYQNEMEDNNKNPESNCKKPKKNHWSWNGSETKRNDILAETTIRDNFKTRISQTETDSLTLKSIFCKYKKTARNITWSPWKWAAWIKNKWRNFSIKNITGRKNENLFVT